METQKFIFNSGAMVSALTIATKVMSKNPVVPVLENYYLDVNNGRLTVTGTDLQTTMRVSFSVESKENFSCLIPPTVIKYLQKVIKEDGPAPITLCYDHESYSVELLLDDSRAKYSSENYSDFPNLPQTDIEMFETTSDLFKEFKDLIVYTSTDELRPAMTGIAFLDHDKKLHLSATDGHRLKVVNVDSEALTFVEPENDNTYFILAAKVAKVLSDFKFKKGNETRAGVVVKSGTDINNSKVVSFSFRYECYDIELMTRAIDERFPDIWNVIPTDTIVKGKPVKWAQTKFTIDNKDKFLSTIDRAMLFANAATHQIRISLNGVNKISAEDLDFKNEFNQHIAGTYEGQPIEIGFNGKYFSEVVNSFSDKITIEMQAPNRCAVIRQGNALALVMPVMLNQYV